jgi:hypothetical protein
MTGTQKATHALRGSRLHLLSSQELDKEILILRPSGSYNLVKGSMGPFHILTSSLHVQSLWEGLTETIRSQLLPP